VVEEKNQKGGNKIMKKVMKDYVDFNDAKYFNQISD